MLAQLGYEVTPAVIGGMYRDISATLVLDASDDGECAAAEAAGMKPVLLPTVMRTLADKQRLAQAIIARCGASA
jgi:hypothetical protein